MKKIIAVILLIIYLLSIAPITELLKFPVLVTHYFRHKEINKNIDVIQFIKLHYLSEKNSSNSSKEDNQLPFKYSHTNGICFLSLPSLISYEIFTKKEWLTIAPVYIPNYLHLPDKFAANIWQPPRI